MKLLIPSSVQYNGRDRVCPTLVRTDLGEPGAIAGQDGAEGARRFG